jgi:transposase-like protein
VGERLAEFVPFLTFDTESRRIVCTTNAIESVNSRIRRAIHARRYFPTEQAGRPPILTHHLADQGVALTG